MTDKEVKQEIDRLKKVRAQTKAMREGDLHTVASAVGDYLAKGVARLHKVGIPMDYSKEFLSPRVYDGLREILDKMGLELRVRE